MSGKRSPLMDAWSAWLATDVVADRSDPNREGKMYLAAMTAFMRTSADNRRIEEQQREERQRWRELQRSTQAPWVPPADDAWYARAYPVIVREPAPTPAHGSEVTNDREMSRPESTADQLDESHDSSTASSTTSSKSGRYEIRTPARTLALRVLLSTCVAAVSFVLIGLEIVDSVFWDMSTLLALIVAAGIAVGNGMGLAYVGISRLVRPRIPKKNRPG